MKPLPPPPRTNDPAVDRWLVLLYGAFRELGGRIKEGDGEGGVTDHTALDNLNSSQYTHLTASQAAALTGGASTTLHSHPILENPADFTQSAALLALSEVTPSADTVPYFTSTTAAATTGLTAYSRTLLDDADATTWRATLGLGTMAVETATDYLSKAGNLSGLASAATSRTNLGVGATDTPAFKAAVASAAAVGSAAVNAACSFQAVNTTNSAIYSYRNDSSNAGIFEYYNGVSWTEQARFSDSTQLELSVPLKVPSITLGATALTATGTELNYVDGVTSAIQTQLDSKAGTASPTFTGTVSAAAITASGAVSADTLADAKGDVRTIPQNSKSADYTLVLSDAGKHILHPTADTTTRTFTIPANSSVAFPVGTAVTFVNQASAGTLTLAITTDTLRLAGAGTIGSRTLAANGIATALKVTSTEWLISGTNLT